MDNLLNEYNKCIEIRNQYYQQYKQYEKKINKLEKEIYNNCSHIWEIEKQGVIYSKKEYICKICNLYKTNIVFSYCARGPSLSLMVTLCTLKPLTQQVLWTP